MQQAWVCSKLRLPVLHLGVFAFASSTRTDEFQHLRDVGHILNRAGLYFLVVPDKRFVSTVSSPQEVLATYVACAVCLSIWCCPRTTMRGATGKATTGRSIN